MNANAAEHGDANTDESKRKKSEHSLRCLPHRIVRTTTFARERNVARVSHIVTRNAA